MANALDAGEAAREIDKLMALHPKGFDLSLGRIGKLLDILGRPQDRMPPVIHIAGTNGKGSTSAYCRALLEAQGLSVHTHTKPHLVRWHERYRLGVKGGPGKLVADNVLADAVRRVAEANNGQHITVFEVMTAVMFLLFSEHPADAAIVEVGLGGRFDATNVVVDPVSTVITPISMDHEAFLGDSVEKIAAEKAGIIKPGRPVVIGYQPDDEARDVLEDTAIRNNAPVQIFGQDYLAYEEYGRMVYQDQTGLMELPLPRLFGRHQISNAATAIRAVRSGGFELSEEAIAQAMLEVDWPARMQHLTAGRLLAHLPEGSELWLDGGHNPGAGSVIAEALATLNERKSMPVYIISGMINTKDASGYFKPFNGLVSDVLTVPVTGSDASVDPVVLASDAADAGLTAEPHRNLVSALQAIKMKVGSGTPPRVLVGGSVYLAGEVLEQNGTIPE